MKTICLPPYHTPVLLLDISSNYESRRAVRLPGPKLL